MSHNIDLTTQKINIQRVWSALGGRPLKGKGVEFRGQAFWRDSKDYNISINTRHNTWCDHSHHSHQTYGGSVLGLVCTGLQCTRSQALEWLVANRLYTPPPPPSRQTTTRQTQQHTNDQNIPPPSPSNPESNEQNKYTPRRQADVVYGYEDAKGVLLFEIRRWNRRQGKIIRPFRFRAGRWRSEHYPAPRPLYRLPLILQNPDKPVLIVEGEKVVESVRERLQHCYVVTTWCGGSAPKTIRQTDWKPLSQRRIILCPDRDLPGRKAMTLIGNLLSWEGPREISMVTLDDNLNDGFDLADLPRSTDLEDWIDSRLTPWLLEKHIDYSLIEPLPEPIADHFVHYYQNIFRQDVDKGSWFYWDKLAWRRDKRHHTLDQIRKFTRQIRELYRLSEDSKSPYPQLASGQSLLSIETLCRRDPRMTMEAAMWDNDPYLLGTPEGVVELRTGILRPARPTDFISLSTRVVPSSRGEYPRKWLQFLSEATEGQSDLIDFIQRWCGYCLTGDTSEHAVVFVYGRGGTGKSTFINTLTYILHEYHVASKMETFTSGRDEHPTELAWLTKARLVTASETDAKRQWRQARIKELTGGGLISARYIGQNFFQYEPEFKLMFQGNERPQLDGPGRAEERRFHIVPFESLPVSVNYHLKEELRQEAGQILRWMIDGCLLWQQHKLSPPLVVVSATREYLAEQDLLARWVSELCCVVEDGCIAAREAYASFKGWCNDNNERAYSSMTFKRHMQHAGYKFVSRLTEIQHPKRPRGYLGLKLLQDNDDIFE